MALFVYLCRTIVLQNIIPIASESLHIDQLVALFKSHTTFSRNDLFDFYKKLERDISIPTLNWRVHSLLRENVIKLIGKGKYALGEANEFKPEIDSQLIKMSTQLKKSFPYAKICLWSTKILNQWMLHQPAHFFILVEVEKDAMESVFSFIQEHHKDAFLRPGKEILERYAVPKSDAIIILPLISEAPLQEIRKVPTVTVEKIIVDIFCEPSIFAAQQGSDLTFLYNNVFASYTINTSKMLRYADRRKKKGALLNYLIDKTNFRHFYPEIANI